LRGDHEAGVRALERGIGLAHSLGLSALANALTTDLGDAAGLAGDTHRARMILEAVLTTGRDTVWLPGTGQALTALAWLEARAAHATEALAVVLAADNRVGIAQCLALLGHVAEEGGDLAGARAQHQRGLELSDETGDRRARALALEGLASVDLCEGDAATAA